MWPKWPGSTRLRRGAASCTSGGAGGQGLCISGWLLAARGGLWPGSPDDFVCYLEARAGDHAQAALEFMEVTGGMAPHERIAEDPVIEGAVAELIARLETASPQERKVATRVPIGLLAAWGRAVVEVSLESYARVVAGLRSVKYWGALRFDDLWWADPAKMHLDFRGPVVSLERTKVADTGKSVERLVTFMARERIHLGEWLVGRLV